MIYEYPSLQTTVTKTDLLDWLSGEMYKTQSHIYNPDTIKFIQQVTGQSSWSLVNQRLENSIHVFSKATFKQLGLSHWDKDVQLLLFLLLTFVPACILAVITTINLGFTLINMGLDRMHQ